MEPTGLIQLPTLSEPSFPVYFSVSFQFSLNISSSGRYFWHSFWAATLPGHTVMKIQDKAYTEDFYKTAAGVQKTM